MSAKPLAIGLAMAAVAAGGCGDDGRDRVSGGGVAETASTTTNASRDNPTESVAAGGKRKIYGDGSVELFGEQAGDHARAAVVAVAERFYDAMYARDWATACDLVVSHSARDLAQSLMKLTHKKTCAAGLAVLVGRRPRGVRYEYPESTRFTDVRVKGDRAFVLFEGPHIRHGFLPMERESGVWKVNTFTGAPL